MSHAQAAVKAGRQLTDQPVSPSQALAWLHWSLSEHGIRTVGMTLSRSDGVLFPACGQAVGYAHGLYWWPARVRDGRPVYAIHPAADPHGAARRLAHAWQRAADPL
jgi:hypothetical protein